MSNIFPGLQVVSSLLAVLLFLAAGLSIAALVATSWHRFWFYVNEGGIRLRYGNFNTAAAPPYLCLPLPCCVIANNFPLPCRTGYFQWEQSTDTLTHSLKVKATAPAGLPLMELQISARLQLMYLHDAGAQQGSVHHWHYISLFYRHICAHSLGMPHRCADQTNLRQSTVSLGSAALVRSPISPSWA